MHSTLPALYHPSSQPSQNQSNHEPKRPHKQNEFYNLSISMALHNNYRTRILNPLHRASLNQEEDRIPKYARLQQPDMPHYPRRSLSMQSHHEGALRTLDFSIGASGGSHSNI